MKDKRTYYPYIPFEDDKGKWGFKNPVTNEVYIAPIYDWASEFYEGLAAVEQNGKQGYIDKHNNVVIPFIYSYVEDFNDGYATVYDDRGEHKIEKDGSLYITPKEYEGKYGYVEYDEFPYIATDVVIPFIYENAKEFSEGFAAVQKDGKWGYINKKGKLICPFIYDEAERFSEGLAAVKKDRRWGYINDKGELAIPLWFADAKPFSDGLAAVTKGYYIKRYEKESSEGVEELAMYFFYEIDKTSEIEIPRDILTSPYGICVPKEEAKEIPDEVTLWEIGRSAWGYINHKGEIVLPHGSGYEQAESFSEGRAKVEIDNSGGYYLPITTIIDKEGNEIADTVDDWEFPEPFKCGRALVQKWTGTTHKYGYMDLTGKIVIPIKYDYAHNFENGMAHVRIGENWMFIDIEGNEINC